MFHKGAQVVVTGKQTSEFRGRTGTIVASGVWWPGLGRNCVQVKLHGSGIVAAFANHEVTLSKVRS